MHLLLPPLEQQLSIANELLKCDPTEMRKSQKINLRMILQSINDPKTIGLLTQLCQDHAGTISEVITLLETLLIIDSKTLKGILLKNTDLGSLIGNFDCKYSTVWDFSNFPATNILCKINFG